MPWERKTSCDPKRKDDINSSHRRANDERTTARG
jgi:hypothetical protein